MTEMLSDVVALVQRALKGPCQVAKGTPIAVACSGGADSVGLVAALAELSDTWPSGGVFYVDHGLRQATAEKHSARVAAERAGAEFTALRLNLAEGSNLQARARSARYEALEEAVPSGTLIATGHTRTDQAETVLQRIVRGAGLRGLRGVHWRQGRLVRPMLGVPRDATRAIAGLFADDPTNESDRYQRNRIRRTVMPLLVAENPDIEAALARVALQASGDYALLRACLARTPLRGVDLARTGLELREAWLRASWPEGVACSRQAIEGFAAALGSGGMHGPVRVDPETLVSLVEGELTVIREVDPRRQVVAHGIGSYRLESVMLVIGEGGVEQPSNPDAAPHTLIAETFLNPRTLTWPLTLQHLSRHEPTGVRDTVPGPRMRALDGTGAVVWEVGEATDSRRVGRDLRVAVFRL